MRAELRSHAGEKPWAPARPVQLHWMRSRGAHLVWQIRLHALAGFRPEAPDKRAFVSGAHCTDITTAFALIVRGLQAAGATSLRAIADGLNAKKIPTARGTGPWSAVQVQRVLERL
jgi:hypothetical protein